MSVPSATSGWLPIFEDFTRDLRISSKEINSDDDRGAPLVMWESQHRFLREVAAGLDRGIRTFMCLKSRQLGVTTVSLAIGLFWLAMNKNMTCALVTENESNREKNRATLRHYLNSFPEDYFGESFYIVKGGDNRQTMKFSNGSRIDFKVAGTKKKSTSWGEGDGYAMVHLCMARGTPVIVADGRVKPIEQVLIGEKVLTHTGAEATVVDVIGQPNTKGRMLRINPWLGEPVLVTDEHTIPTQRGLVEAKDLKLTDSLLMPVRQIDHGVKEIRLSSTEKVGSSLNPAAPGWVRQKANGSGAVLAVDEELGFFVGYYLAEGSMRFGRNKRPCGITFVRHRDEKSYADRAIAPVEHVTGKRRTTDRDWCLATTEDIGGVPLCQWVADTFGFTDTKRIPDEVFTWGEEFCRGLLAGLLCGDGSKTATWARVKTVEQRKNADYALNTMVLPTTRASIAMQARDLACALGYGWASAKFTAGAVRNGRVEKDQWRVLWSGAAAAGLRAVMGLPEIPREGHDWTNKYVIEDGLVYLRIKSLEWDDGSLPEMWDISVDHADHTFRTPSMAVGNTEVAAYGSDDGLKSFIESFAQVNPNRLFLFESTAKGFNLWSDMWRSARQGSFTEHAFFIGWWASNTNRIERDDARFAAFNQIPVSREEREKMAEVARLYGWTITPEQLAWIRWREDEEAKKGGDRMMLDQNQPWTESDAFVQSGYSFFPTRQITKDIKAIDDASSYPRPVSEGGYAFKGYKYFVDGSFFDMRLIEEKEDLAKVELRVWEEPVEGGRYMIGCDPAWGRNDHKDRSCCSVWRGYADKIVQVAEFASADVEVKHCAWVLAHLAGAYGDCLVNYEVNGPGNVIKLEWDHIRGALNADLYARVVRERDWTDALSSARWYLYARPDGGARPSAIGFSTNFNNKATIMHGFKGGYATGELVIRSRPMLYEMINVQVLDGKIGAPESKSTDGKDDRVFGAAFAHRAWTEWVRPGMMNEGLTYEVVTQQELVDPDLNARLNRHVRAQVMQFFQAQADRSNVPAANWRNDYGL